MTNILSSIKNDLPLMVIDELEKLPFQKQEQFVDEYKRRSKSRGTGFILWIIGFHYLYIGKIGLQILFWLTLGGYFIWWIVDFFRTSIMINNYNKDVAIDILKNIKIISE